MTPSIDSPECVHGHALMNPEPCPKCDVLGRRSKVVGARLCREDGDGKEPQACVHRVPMRVHCPECAAVVKTPTTNKDTNPKDAIAGTRLPLWLCSPIAKAHWAMAQFAGLVKYGAWNWRAAGVRKSVYLSAIERHLDAIKSGEKCDPVDGTRHEGNIMACCAILLDAEAAGKVTDDRAPVVEMRTTYRELESLMAKLKEQYADKSPKHYTIEDSISN